jgi:N-acetylmuramic acid 6-phosphate etherase
MFSTIVMVQLGKTYGNLMVDVKPTNEKLRERAVRMVQSVTGAGRADALAALAANNYSVKQTIVALRLDLSPEEAAAQLTMNGALLRAALGEQA